MGKIVFDQNKRIFLKIVFARSENATFRHEILELGSNNNLAQHRKLYIFFSSKSFYANMQPSSGFDSEGPPGDEDFIWLDSEGGFSQQDFLQPNSYMYSMFSVMTKNRGIYSISHKKRTGQKKCSVFQTSAVYLK